MRTGMIIGALLVSGLAVTGCVPSEEASPQPPAPGTPPPADAIAPAQVGGPEAPNKVPPANTDREFAQQLLAFNTQSKELTDLAKRASEEEGVQHLAERLEKQQQPLQNRLDQWLRSARGQGSASAPQDQNVGDMIKMPPVEQEAVTTLHEFTGEEFERHLARTLGQHLEHTVEMAHTELEDGSTKPMRDLAEHLVETREPLVKEAKELQAHL